MRPRSPRGSAIPRETFSASTKNPSLKRGEPPRTRGGLCHRRRRCYLGGHAVRRLPGGRGGIPPERVNSMSTKLQKFCRAVSLLSLGLILMLAAASPAGAAARKKHKVPVKPHCRNV